MTALFALFAALTTALAPLPPSAACAPSDLRCLGEAHVQEAQQAEPGARTQHLAAASSAYIGLFRETGDSRHLCTAETLAVQGLALGSLSAVLTRYRDEARAELSRLQAVCPPASSPRSGTPMRPKAPTTARTRPRPTAPLSPDNPTTSETADAPVVPPTTLEPTPPAARSTAISPPRPSALLLADAPTPQPDPLLPVRAQPRNPSRPGLGLLVAGSLSFGAALALGGIAGHAATRRNDLVRTGDALHHEATAQGYTDPTTAAAWPEMEAAAQRWHRALLGTAITGGLLGAVSIALLTAGAHRRHSVRNVAARPSLGGVLFLARF